MEIEENWQLGRVTVFLTELQKTSNDRILDLPKALDETWVEKNVTNTISINHVLSSIVYYNKIRIFRIFKTIKQIKTN